VQSTKTFDHAVVTGEVLDLEPEHADLEMHRPSKTGVDLQSTKIFENAMTTQDVLQVDPEIANLQVHQRKSLALDVQSTRTFDNLTAIQHTVDFNPEQAHLQMHRPSIPGIDVESTKVFENTMAAQDMFDFNPEEADLQMHQPGSVNFLSTRGIGNCATTNKSILTLHPEEVSLSIVNQNDDLHIQSEKKVDHITAIVNKVFGIEPEPTVLTMSNQDTLNVAEHERKLSTLTTSSALTASVGILPFRRSSIGELILAQQRNSALGASLKGLAHSLSRKRSTIGNRVDLRPSIMKEALQASVQDAIEFAPTLITVPNVASFEPSPQGILDLDPIAPTYIATKQEAMSLLPDQIDDDGSSFAVFGALDDLISNPDFSRSSPSVDRQAESHAELMHRIDSLLDKKLSILADIDKKFSNDSQPSSARLSALSVSSELLKSFEKKPPKSQSKKKLPLRKLHLKKDLSGRSDTSSFMSSKSKHSLASKYSVSSKGSKNSSSSKGSRVHRHLMGTKIKQLLQKPVATALKNGKYNSSRDWASSQEIDDDDDEGEELSQSSFYSRPSMHERFVISVRNKDIRDKESWKQKKKGPIWTRTSLGGFGLLEKFNRTLTDEEWTKHMKKRHGKPKALKGYDHTCFYCRKTKKSWKLAKKGRQYELQCSNSMCRKLYTVHL